MELTPKHIMIGGCMLIMLSLFLPFIQSDAMYIASGSRYIDTIEGKILLVIMIIEIIIIWYEEVEHLQTWFAIVSFMNLFYYIFHVTRGFSYRMMDMFLGFKGGFYILVFGFIFLFVGLIFANRRR